MLAIERKTSSDFLNTLRDDRLFPQMAKLKTVSPWPYLVICGELRPGPNGQCLTEGRETGWNWASVSGALLSVQELGIHVVQCAGDTDYEATIIRLANRDRSNLRVSPPRDVTIIGEAEVILSSLPSIGAEKVQAILSYAGNPAYALQWLTDDTGPNGQIPGIGDVTKRKIRRSLGLKEDEVLAVMLKTAKVKEGAA
jgi:ERCC4-type nuclease